MELCRVEQGKQYFQLNLLEAVQEHVAILHQQLSAVLFQVAKVLHRELSTSSMH